MNRFDKLVTAARVWRGEESVGPPMVGQGRVLFLAASGQAEDGFLWLRGMVWGCGASAAVAACTLLLPKPEPVQIIPEIQVLSGLARYETEVEAPL